jgi:hypothetical protein
MIQVWADLLDHLAAGKPVGPVRDLRQTDPVPQELKECFASFAGADNGEGFLVAA